MPRRHHPAFALAAALLGGTALLPGAAAPAQPVPAPAPAAALVDLDFKGGTAVDYIEAVRRAGGEVNVMVAPEAADVPIPAVTLRRVSINAALQLLDDRQHRSTTHAVELHVEGMDRFAEGERPTFQVRADVRGTRPLPAARVWSLRSLLDGGMSSKAIMSALDVALDVVGAGEQMDVRFHEETGLLIARGPASELVVVDEVIGRLRDAARAGDESDEEQRLGELRSRIQELEALLRIKEVEVADLQVRLRRLHDEPSRDDG